jgi:multicomponent Na+:H+ antiporter subunit E
MNFIFVTVIIAIWLVLSGNLSYFFVVSGISLSLITLLIFLKLELNKIVKFEEIRIFRTIHYFFWLLIEIIKSSQNIIKIIWQPTLNISPTYGYIDAENLEDLGKTVYASSITLTPGTITMQLDQNRLIAHSITSEGFDDLLSCRMKKKINKIFKFSKIKKMKQLT